MNFTYLSIFGLFVQESKPQGQKQPNGDAHASPRWNSCGNFFESNRRTKGSGEFRGSRVPDKMDLFERLRILIRLACWIWGRLIHSPGRLIHSPLLFRQSLFLFERILIKMARWIWGRLIHSRNLAGTACKGLCISFGWWWRFSSSTRVLRNSFQGFWFLSQRLNLFDLNVSFVWGRLRLQCQSTRRSIRKAAAHRRSWL